MTKESDSLLPLPVTCTVSRMIRVAFDWDQQLAASALKLNRKALSAKERCTKGETISRQEIETLVERLQRPKGVVEEVFLCVQRIIARLQSEPTGFEAEVRELADQVGASYGQEFHETTIAARRAAQVMIDRQIANSLWTHFSALPQRSRRSSVEKEAMYLTWGFAERLWRESLDAAADDSDRALELGEMSLWVAERAEGDSAFGRRLQGLALSAVANAQRVGGDLPIADRTLARAKTLWNQGAPGKSDILDEPRFLSVESTLRVDQRRLEEGLEAIDAAFAAARPGSDVLYLQISRGNILFHAHQFEQAEAVYLAATARMRPSTPPRVRFGTLFNLTACVIALGRPGIQRDRIPLLREMAVALGNGIDLLRVRWLEGQALAGGHQNEEAIAILGEVRDGFLDRDILLDAARVSLERAALQLEAGELQRVRQEAPELAEAFRYLRVAPELLTSVALFWAAAQAEKATAEQARLVLAQLNHLQGVPISAG